MLFQSRSYFLLAGLNLIWIPIVFLCESSLDVEMGCCHELIFLSLQSIRRLGTARLSPLKLCSQPAVPSIGGWNRLINCMVMSWCRMESLRTKPMICPNRHRQLVKTSQNARLYSRLNGFNVRLDDCIHPTPLLYHDLYQYHLDSHYAFRASVNREILIFMITSFSRELQVPS